MPRRRKPRWWTRPTLAPSPFLSRRGWRRCAASQMRRYGCAPSPPYATPCGPWAPRPMWRRSSRLRRRSRPRRPRTRRAPGRAAVSDAPVSPADPGELDPWDLDARLRGLVRLRQSLAWRQGRLLAAVASFDLHRELGYDSAGDWCRLVLGMSPRRARYLVSLDRRLDRIPLVADAYRRGLVSWCQARLLVRVARPGTESRWIRYARQVTARRLEDVITACAVAAADPAVGGQARTLQDGAPLPPSEPLPGTLPTRHTLAPLDRFPPLPGDAD